MMIKNKRIKIFANKFHRQAILLIFAAILFPVIIAVLCLYYLIFDIVATQIMIPEVIAQNIIPAAKKVTIILAILLPLVISTILFVAHRITQVIIGPFDRVDNDLNSRIENSSNEPINIRTGDKFEPLVDKINRLLAKLKDKE